MQRALHAQTTEFRRGRQVLAVLAERQHDYYAPVNLLLAKDII